MSAPVVIYSDDVESSPFVVTKLYVDIVNGDDNNDGLSWATAKQTDAVFDLVPNGGWCAVYVRSHGGTFVIDKRTLPYAQYEGQLSIIGDDAWAETDFGVVTNFAHFGGKYFRDEITIAWDSHVPSDATDRQQFIRFTDDDGNEWIWKVYEYMGANVYEAFSGFGNPNMAAGNEEIHLVKPTTTIAPALVTQAGTFATNGRVGFIGCVLASPGQNGFREFDTTACHIDATAHNAAFAWGSKGFCTKLFTDDLGVLAPQLYIPRQLLEGTVMEKTQGGAYGAASYLEMSGAGYAYFADDNPGSYNLSRCNGLVYEGGNIEFWNAVHTTFNYARGVEDGVSGFRALARSLVDTNGVNCDKVTAEADGYIRVQTLMTPEIDIIEGWLGSSGGVKTIDLVTSNPTRDSHCLRVHRGGVTGQIEIKGGYSTSGVALPATRIDGICEGLELNFDDMDRGDGPVNHIRGGARVELIKCVGDNLNLGVGGTNVGLQIEDQTYVEADDDGTGNLTATGADGDVLLGASAAPIAWPAPPSYNTDLAAVAPQMSVLKIV